MKLLKFHLTIFLSISLLLTSTAHSQAAEHIGADLRLYWNTQNVYLDSKSYLEQEITPLETDSLKDGAAFKWTNQYHLDFCWFPVSNLEPNAKCGYVGFGLGSKNGNNYTGNFDFAIFNALEFKRVSNDVSCNNAANAEVINSQQTYYLNCWKSVSIQMNTTYVFRIIPSEIQHDSSNNWWSAQLINKTSGDKITIGSIKAAGNNTARQLSMAYNVTFYSGDKVPCASVPKVDSQVSPPKDSRGGTATYSFDGKGNCGNFNAFQLNDGTGRINLRVGGSNPSSRDSFLAKNALRSPRSNSSWQRPDGLLPGLSEVKYQGYFNDNSAYFTDDAVKLNVNSTSSKQLPVWKDSTSIGSDVSYWWGGYFIPDETGIWDFNLTSDDSSFMWIGNDAVARYEISSNSAFIGLPGTHPPQSKENSIYLEKNKVYPIRIQYGNVSTYGSFSLSVKPPSFKNSWDTNLEGLIWFSDYTNRQDCTNYGISYSLAAKLGYDIIDVKACINNPAKIYGNQNSGAPGLLPQKPSISKVSIVDNVLYLEINVGKIAPDNIYLISQSLGIDESTALLGKINGTVASWKINLNKKLLGTIANLAIVSELDGNKSEPLNSQVKLSNSSPKPKSIPSKSSPKPKASAAPKKENQLKVLCKRAGDLREFKAKQCPPGWSKK